MSITTWVIAALLLVAGVLEMRTDPRRLRCGMLLVAGTIVAVLAIVGTVLDSLGRADAMLQAWGLIAIGALSALGLLLIGTLLVTNGWVMLRLERRSLANRLSLVVGALVLAFIVASIVAISRSDVVLLVWLLGISLPAMVPAFMLVVIVVYGWIYARATRGAGDRADAVVVLGAGLVHGRVTALLGRRIDRGIVAYEAARAAGHETVLVLSGGKGSDESRPEAEAMADHARERGVPEEHLVLERRSASTEENLRFSDALLAERGIGRAMLVATSDYHVLRAALLMRSLGLVGHAVGAPTAAHYRPSATLRELLAVLRDHIRLTLVAMALLTLPLAAGIVISLVRLAAG